MFCSHCGAKIPDDARFCSSCGAKLDAVKAPVQPDPRAKELLDRGMQLKNGGRGGEALTLFAQAADLGDAEASYQAGICCLSAEPADMERGMGYLYRAASKNHADARKSYLDSLWSLYEEAIKTQTYAPILPYLQKAAELGDAGAQAKLAAFYMGAQGCLEKDLRAARYWAERSAAQGDADGAVVLKALNNLS